MESSFLFPATISLTLLTRVKPSSDSVDGVLSDRHHPILQVRPHH
jgi:hypothetical protein